MTTGIVMGLFLSISLALVGGIVLAAAIALYAMVSNARSAGSAERCAGPQGGDYNLAVFQEFIVGEYLERGFKASPEAPTIDGQRVGLLREARAKALNYFEQNPEAWDQTSSLSNQGTWQNRVAFETAYALQNLGTATITGMIPLRLILAVVGDVVIDDWLLCGSWVKSYREDQQTVLLAKGSDPAIVHYHRRHAEWLALVALVWMTQHWSCANCELVAQRYGGMQSVSERLQSLCRADALLMPEAVQQAVRTLTGVDV